MYDPVFHFISKVFLDVSMVYCGESFTILLNEVFAGPLCASLE